MKNWFAIEVCLSNALIGISVTKENASNSRQFLCKSLDQTTIRLELILFRYATVGLAVVGGSWYLSRLARGPDGTWWLYRLAGGM